MNAESIYGFTVLYAIFSAFLFVVVVSSFLEAKESGSAWPIISVTLGVIAWIFLGVLLFRGYL